MTRGPQSVQDRTLRAVLVGILRDDERLQPTGVTYCGIEQDSRRWCGRVRVVDAHRSIRGAGG